MEIPGRRARALLAVLAMSVGTPVPAEVLYDRVWGIDERGYVRANVYTYVNKLRGLLGKDAIGGRDGAYSLRVPPDAVDALRFSRTAKQAASMVGADQERGMREAYALWTGTPFGGPMCPWLDEIAAPRLTDDWLTLIESLADIHLADGDCAAVAELVEPVAREHPLRESLWVRLLRGLAGAGREAEALAAYERERVWLADQLGVDPSPELQRLHARLLAGERLDEEIAARPPRQLPAERARIVGRRTAMTQLDALALKVGDRSPVLGVLHGLGGVGKTALAVHWGHSVAGRFPDGQLFVSLRGYGPGEPVTPSAALARLLGGIGVAPELIPDDIDQRSAQWRTLAAGKRLLVILDNARDAEQIRPLLPGSGCLTLVTSRSRMRGLSARDGATQIALDPLPLADAEELLAGRREPGLVAEPDVRRDLAHLCDRLPLALVVAADRICARPGSARELVEDLRDQRNRLEVLGDPEDPLSDLRTVLSWSYDALDPEAARLFRLLGLLPNVDIGVEGVAALAGLQVPPTRRLLARLREANLVAGDERFDMHDLVRAYAAERVELEVSAETRESVLGRVDRWCAISAYNALMALRTLGTGFVRLEPVENDPEPEDFGDAEAADRWLEREGAFLESWARMRFRGSPKATIAIAQRLANAWREKPRGRVVDVLDLAVDAAEASGDPALLAGALHERTIHHAFAGDSEQARRDAMRALDVAEQNPGTFPLRVVLYGAGLVARHAGRLDEAAGYLERGLEAAERDQQTGMVVSTHNELALAFLELRDVERALHHAERGVELAVEAGSPAGPRMMVLDTLGQAQLEAGEAAASIATFDEVAALAGDTSPRVRAVVLHHRGRAHAAAGQSRCAAEDFRQAVAVIDEVELPDDGELNRSAILHDLQAVESRSR